MIKIERQDSNLTNMTIRYQRSDSLDNHIQIQINLLQKQLLKSLIEELRLKIEKDYKYLQGLKTLADPDKFAIDFGKNLTWSLSAKFRDYSSDSTKTINNEIKKIYINVISQLDKTINYQNPCYSCFFDVKNKELRKVAESLKNDSDSFNYNYIGELESILNGELIEVRQELIGEVKQDFGNNV
jgi:hypothetical protein